MENFYEVLAVGENATVADIAASYETLHAAFITAGMAPGAAMIERLNEAHRILSDPAARIRFDRELSDADGRVQGLPLVDAESIPEAGPQSLSEPSTSKKGRPGPVLTALSQRSPQWMRRHARLTVFGCGLILAPLLACGYGAVHPAGVSPSKPSASATKAPVAVVTVIPPSHPVDATAEQQAAVEASVLLDNPKQSGTNYLGQTFESGVTSTIVSGRTTASAAVPLCFVVKISAYDTRPGSGKYLPADRYLSLLLSDKSEILYALSFQMTDSEKGCDMHMHFSSDDRIGIAHE